MHFNMQSKMTTVMLSHINSSSNCS